MRAHGENVVLVFASEQESTAMLNAHRYILRHTEGALAVWESRDGSHFCEERGGVVTFMEAGDE